MRLKFTLPLLGAVVVFVFLSVNRLQAQQPVTGGKKDLTGNKTINESKNDVSTDNSPSVIYLNAGKIDVQSAEAKTARRAINAFSGKQMHLIKFNGAIQPSWYKLLTDAGVQVVDYIPNFTYLVFGDYTSIQKLQTEAKKENTPIAWDGEYLPAYRVMPAIFGSDAKGGINKNVVTYSRFEVQLFLDPETNTATRNLMKLMRTPGTQTFEQQISHYVNITVSLSPEAMRQISEQPDVISVYPYIEPKKNDEAQNIIMTGQLTGNSPTPGNYLTWLTSKGFTQAQFDASNFVVNVNDDGLDNGVIGTTLQPTSHFALFKLGDVTQPSRVAFINKQGTATDADSRGVAGHGTINSHIVGGYVPDNLLSNSFHTDANNFRYGLGVAPFVKLGNSVFFTTGGSFTNPNFANTESQSYQAGGRISTNSWGASVGGAYNASAQSWDFLVRDAQPAGSTFPTAGNQEMVVFFSAGNSGPGANTIGSPGTGKNVITVGASENVRPFGGSDGCGTTDAQANSANDIIGFSSRGPCDDGRIKPDIVAPGTHITGGNYQTLPAVAPPLVGGPGSANPLFNASGVCGGLAGANHFPGTQQWTTASSGTSHSCPAVAGFGALIRQDFINRSFPAPSPAMTKAMILSSAAYMNGVGANDNLFSNNQGMGLVHMNNYFASLDNPHIRRDQVPADIFTASGQQFVRSGTVANNALPVRITLAYTDAPGPTSGNAYVNNLDLEVTVGGNTYFGNVFTGALSTTGGAADPRNNVESVFLPAGTSGPIVVRVRATNIAGDGVPNSGGALDQDFALIVTNVTEALLPAISAASSSIVTEGCAPGNGAIDPGETVTVSFCMQNAGTANTANLVATLQSTGGVTSPSGPQNYGVLIAGGAAVCRNFTFTASGACGSTITATFALQDGATNLGTITYNFVLGTLVPAGTATFSYTGPAVAIPDNTPAGVNVPLVVSGAGSVLTDLNFRFDVAGACDATVGNTNAAVDHTFVGDLIFKLTSPSGTTVTFMNQRGGTRENICLTTIDDEGGFPNVSTITSVSGTPVSGNFSPETSGPLSLFDGQNPNGTWTLNVSDNAGVDVGSVRRFSLILATSSPSCCVSPTSPTVTIDQAIAQPDPTSTSPINFTVVFSEPVTGFATGDVTLSGTAGATTGTVTGGPTTYNVAVSGMTGNGTVIASIGAGVATGTINVTGNAPSTSTDNQVTYNVIPPTVTIDQAVAQPDPTSTSPINFTVVFSEPVTGFATGDVTLSGTAGATTGTVTGGPTTYNVAVSGMTGNGTVIASIGAGVATGTINVTGNAASTSVDNTVTFNSSLIVNDNCANALPIACGGTASGTTIGATIDGPPTSCPGLSIAPDVWYTIVGNGGNITASLCGSSYDTKIDIYTGTCGALVCVGGDDDFCAFAGPSEFTWLSVAATTYYIRVHGYAGATGAFTLNVTCACVTPTVNPVANQTVCNGAPVSAVNFTGTPLGVTFDWTNNTPSIGLAASGSGNISSFNAVNTGTAPVTATITVTPKLTGCADGVPVSFTITVNPTATVNAVSNQTVCNGAPTTAVNFSSPTTGGTIVYNWTNNTPSIGLAAGGSGNIASFTATNTGTAPVTATITVTPTYTNNSVSCVGTASSFTITVNPTATVNAVSNQTVCNGAPTTAVNFSSPTTGGTIVYNWTNNTPSIGLAASGSGNIASFNGVNATNAPVTATITVTPTYTNGVSCIGTPRTFTITVNPTATVNAVANQTVCNGAPTTAVNFTSPTTGGTIVYNWTNNTPSIGLAASGSGNIASFNGINATNAPVTATITVTPTYTNGVSCVGTPRTFTITVNPTATVNAVANQTVCNGAPTTAVTFTSPTTGGTIVYNWTNNTPSIGLAASGTGNIASFTAINASAVPVTATITVTPTYTNVVSCVGTPTTFTITVNPTPTITCPANQSTTTPAGSCTAIVNYAPVVTGTPTPTLSYSFSGATTGSGSGSGSGSAFSIGVTTVTVTATNICATVSCSFTITVADGQLPVITAQPQNRTVCAGQSATFSVTAITSPNANGPLSYQWESWNGSAWTTISGATASSYTVTNATLSQNTNSYRVRVIGLCTTIFSNHATLYVNPNPTVTLSTNIGPALLPTQLLTITATPSIGGGTYQWFKNGVAIAGATGSTLGPLSVDDQGTYRVVYTAPTGCVGTSADLVVSAQQSQYVWIYPNPNNGIFNVRFFNRPGEEATVKVFNTLGQEVFNRKVTTAAAYSTILVDLRSGRVLTSGVYTVVLYDSNGRRVEARNLIIYN